MLGAILSGIGSIGSAIYGAISSKNANDKAQRLLQKQKEDNKHWYDVKMSQDYTKRADVQRAFEKQREILDEQYEKARKSQVVSGATDESVAMQKEASNRAVADATAAVAAEGADYKDRVEQQYRQNEAQLTQQQIANEQQKAQNTASAAGQAVSAGLNVLGNSLGTTKSEAAESAVETAKPATKVVTMSEGAAKVSDAMQKKESENVKNSAQSSLNNTIRTQIPTPAQVTPISGPKKKVNA